ncbi:MAG TPA: hypothetical protein VD886_22710 [Herpetosiphonaceae bacterium]|nr:hypothetical protein [Herpetosiphonaceae bacterium]
MNIDLYSLGLIGQVRLNVNSLSFLEQIAVNFFLGFGLALINVLIIYFFRFVPRVISVSHWHKPGRRWTRLVIFAYLIALVLQMATSPFFTSAFQRVYTELAWSPFQALWTVAGVLVMDAIVFFWTKTRRGVELSKQGIQNAKAMAADKFDGINLNVSNPLSPEARAAAEERRKQEEAAEAAEREARKQRMDDRLKDY